MPQTASIRNPSVLDPIAVLRRWFLVLLTLSLLAIGTVLVFERELYSFYLETFVAPALEQQLGFSVGEVKVSDASGTHFSRAITEVTPGGAFAAAGSRPGDIPIDHNGFFGFWRKLHEARGGVARIRVIRADEGLDWNRSRTLLVRVPKE